MFAIVRTGGKQYKVQPQKVIMIEKLDLPEGDLVTLDKVLMVSDGKAQSLGFPYIEGAFVRGLIVDQIRSDKIIVFKKKRRHNYRRKQGHRQYQTVVRITEISGPKGMHFKSDEVVKPSVAKKTTTPDAKEVKASKVEKNTTKPAASSATAKVAPKASGKKNTTSPAVAKKTTSGAKKSTSSKTKES